MSILKKTTFFIIACLFFLPLQACSDEVTMESVRNMSDSERDEFLIHADTVGRTALNILGAKLEDCERSLDCPSVSHTLVFPDGTEDDISRFPPRIVGLPWLSSQEHLIRSYGVTLLIRGYGGDVMDTPIGGGEDIKDDLRQTYDGERVELHRLYW